MISKKFVHRFSGLDMTLLDIPDLVTFWNYANFPAGIFMWAQTHEPGCTSREQAKNTLEGYYSLRDNSTTG